MSDVRYGFPPTGGDYDWMETDARATCPVCAESFEVRVRIDLDSGEIAQLISSPFPAGVPWRRYVAAEITRHAADMITVKLRHATPTRAAAAAALTELGGPQQLGNFRRAVLVLDGDGYADLNGPRLHASAGESIHYA